MADKKITGLYLRKGIWHIDKEITLKNKRRRRICQSTGTASYEEAVSILNLYISEIRNAVNRGIRPLRTFEQAAAYYLDYKKHKSSIDDDANHLNQIMPFIGTFSLEDIHMGTLQPFIEDRLALGRKKKTINLALGVVRHLLNLAAAEWIDENNLTWLHAAPKIKLLRLDDQKDPYPLDYESQDKFFEPLHSDLRDMAEYKVNTGCREQEVCGLQWSWEVPIPELETSIFLIPRGNVKNREYRIVILNDIAKAVIERRRGIHSKYVFTYKGNRVAAMNNSSWARARKLTGIAITVHDLKHTYGFRLRAAGVGHEDRQDLLGHKTKSITTYYSIAEIGHLIEMSNRVCERKEIRSILTLIQNKRMELGESRKTPAPELKLIVNEKQ